MASKDSAVAQPEDSLTVLHISDAHFGAPDERGEIARLTSTLITAAHTQSLVPDLCVFSGDLAHAGQPSEFAAGQKWLEKLMLPWPDAKLFLVPGNHDVDRGKSKLILRQSYQNEEVFASKKNSLEGNMDHLSSFFEWHRSFQSSAPKRVISDWNNPFGCQAVISKARRIRLVALNTAVLSCDNDDAFKLVQDVQALNGHLPQSDADDTECVIAVGHHPLDWLVEWNRDEVGRLLRQQAGAHLYLHGHRHEQNAITSTSNIGDGLATLECGASYQGSKWPQYFSFYKILFARREIETSIYSFAPSAGKWIRDNARSFTLVAPLPSPELTSEIHVNPQPEPSAVQAADPTKRTDVSDVIDSYLSSIPIYERNKLRDELELAAHRVLNIASKAMDGLYTKIGDEVIKHVDLYAQAARLKDMERVVEKVLQRRALGKKDYDINDIEDFIGVRYVTLFQKDIPRLVSTVLTAAFMPRQDGVLFRFSEGAKVTIHTSRPDSDPLSIVPDVRQALKRWGGKVKINTESKSTGYSSIHLILYLIDSRGDSDRTGLPVEFQLRSGLEEFWGQVDRQLRYVLSRGHVGDQIWQRHLNVLKAQFDAMIQYVDLIREEAEISKILVEGGKGLDSNLDQQESKLSLSTSEEQIRRLGGLPADLLTQVKQAYGLWEQADAARQWGGDAAKFRNAADAFRPFMDGCRDQIDDQELSRLLSIICRQERAYMLLCAGSENDLREAEILYENLLLDQPNDAGSLLRMGQLRIGQTFMDRHLDLAIEYLDRAISSSRSLKSSHDAEAARVYDFANLQKALCNFRKFEEKKNRDADRAIAINSSIKSAIEIVKGGRHLAVQRQALNDLVYYAWEERSSPAIPTNERSISDEDYQLYCKQLITIVDQKDAKPLSFREADTLVRVYADLPDVVMAKSMAEIVCTSLERAAHERSGGLVPSRHSARYQREWILEILEGLKSRDERDALMFATQILSG